MIEIIWRSKKHAFNVNFVTLHTSRMKYSIYTYFLTSKIATIYDPEFQEKKIVSPISPFSVYQSFFLSTYLPVEATSAYTHFSLYPS